MSQSGCDDMRMSS